MTPSWLVKGYPYCLKKTSPSGRDHDFSVGFIWVNIDTAEAYILVSVTDSVAMWVAREPDVIINENTISQINVIGMSNIGSQTLGLGGTGMGVLPPNLVYSDPGPGQYRVTKIKMDENAEVVVTYEDTPIS